MNLQSLHIEGFGVFHDACLDSLSPGLSVFCGSNESGKSTLLGFLRFLFFGFPSGSPPNRYPPLRGGAHGGCLVVRHSDGLFRLERLDKKLHIVRPDGSPGDEADLQTLCGGLNRETFHSVFAFSLSELQQLQKAFEKGAVGDAIYGAGAGIRPELIRQAQASVDQDLKELFQKKGKKGAISNALAALDELEQQIHAAEVDLAEFDRLAEEIAALELSQTQIRDCQAEARRDLEQLQRLAGLLEQQRDKLGQRHTLLYQRSALRLDLSLLAQAEAIRELLPARDHWAALRKQRPVVEQDLERARRDLAGVLSTLGPEWTPVRIEALPFQPCWLDEIAAHQTEWQAAELEAAETRALEQAALTDCDRSLAEEGQAAQAFENLPPPPDRILQDRLLAGRTDFERATGDLPARQAELSAAEEEFRRSLAEIHPEWTAADLERFDISRSAREQLQQLRTRLLEAQSATLASWRDEHRRLALGWARRPRRRWSGPLAGALAVAALAAALAAWPTHPNAALVAGFGALLVFAGWVLLRRATQATLASLQADFALLCRRLGEDRILSDQSLVALERSMESWSGQFDKAEDDAGAAYRQAAGAWRRHLEALGLPPTLSPDGAIDLFSRIETCRERLEKVRTLRHRIDAMEQNRQDYLQLLNDLLAARGDPPASLADLAERLRQFLEAVANEQQLHERWSQTLARRHQAEEILRDRSGRHRQALERRQRVDAAWRQWLGRCGLPPHLAPSGAREFLQALLRARELLACQRDLEQNLRRTADEDSAFTTRLNETLARAGRPVSPDPLAGLDLLVADLAAAQEARRQADLLEDHLARLRDELETLARQIDPLRHPELDLESRRALLLQQQESLDSQLQQTTESLVQCRSRREAMAADERLTRLLEQKETALEQIRQDARRWAVLVLAGHLFDEARRRWEQQRQPAVLLRASDHFRRLTAGRYEAVRRPADSSDLLVVPADGAAPKTTGQLSRGSAEQLYLALRFGFIEEFSRDREPLIIIMDDILVNFDPGRATAAVEALVRLAERFQILFFTCHPETAERFRAVDFRIPVLRITDGRFAAVAAQA